MARVHLRHQGKRRLEFPDGERNISWTIDPNAQLITYTGEVTQIDFDDFDRALSTTSCRTTLEFWLPFDLIWIPPHMTSSGGSSEPSEPSETPVASPPMETTRRRGPRIIRTLRKNAMPRFTPGASTSAAAAPVLGDHIPVFGPTVSEGVTPHIPLSTVAPEVPIPPPEFHPFPHRVSSSVPTSQEGVKGKDHYPERHVMMPVTVVDLVSDDDTDEEDPATPPEYRPAGEPSSKRQRF